ncbi:AraC family transcriptional regulator [Azospirillum rugosum]|uniref:AraC-like DNA-binding protein n=1 Tax=Azospirillum rugosum TaxID=416170 RepID=A0ABS4SHR0_9PROT|nr:helix-turn-helix transcriptional regulator [Azospirillum rugosum]MBP2291578.1 AraC-like DNA-binding protein [Azospirillum rugosum]MDQ0524610.1 AraC-like DNA-binding protein [Azospirillum rugosum]
MVRNVRINEVEGCPSPLIALGHDYEDGGWLAAHSHRRGQLISGATGTLVLSTAQGRWVMPPHCGLWIPPGVLHEVRMIGAVTTQSLYLDPALADAMPARCEVVELSPFVRGLIARALDIPVDYAPDSHDGAVMALLQHEMRRLPAQPLSLPFPAHAALAARCRRFLQEPTIRATIEDWSADLGMSRRTFTRLFRRETGLSFVAWRQQACLVSALPRLVAGTPVTTVALDLGYDNPAAFTTMFKRTLGAAPRAYLAGNG